MFWALLAGKPQDQRRASHRHAARRVAHQSSAGHD